MVGLLPNKRSYDMLKRRLIISYKTHNEVILKGRLVKEDYDKIKFRWMTSHPLPSDLRIPVSQMNPALPHTSFGC